MSVALSGYRSRPEVRQACNSSPASTVAYETGDELEAMLVRRWRRCGSVQARGEDVGVEFSADGAWYALTRDRVGNVVRRQGIDYGGRWAYFPIGSAHPSSSIRSDRAFLELDSVITDPPTFTSIRSRCGFCSRRSRAGTCRSTPDGLRGARYKSSAVTASPRRANKPCPGLLGSVHMDHAMEYIYTAQPHSSKADEQIPLKPPPGRGWSLHSWREGSQSNGLYILLVWERQRPSE